MTDRTHPDSGRATDQTHIIRYAIELGLLWIDGDGRDKVREALDALAALEAQLQARGAGGVNGPLIGQPQAMPDLSQLTERGAKAWAGVDAQELREGRWYMVTHDGVATLCEDRRDAEKEAKDADMAWPHSGPHRAVQLVEASTAGFTAADMATASAQGFRDGVASPSANAGEPVAHLWQHCETGRTRIVMPDMIVDADASWQVVGPLYLGVAPPTAQAEVENLRKALQFYADKEHFAIAEEGAWDTVSGEPQNYWCDEAGTAMVEDGSIAKMSLAGQLINFSDEDEDESAPPTAQAGGWQSIETAPKDGVFLVYMQDEVRPARRMQVANWHPNVKTVGGLFSFDCATVTHWMPLPAPPTSAEVVEHG